MLLAVYRPNGVLSLLELPAVRRMLRLGGARPAGGTPTHASKELA
jgi:hypothetical protein